VRDQAKLYMRDESPFAFVSWARLSGEIAERYRLPPYRLAPNDWNLGDAIWIVDLIAPFGGAQKVISDLCDKRFPGQTIYQFVSAEHAKAEVLTWGPTAA